MLLAWLLMVASGGEVECFGTLVESIVALDDTSVEAAQRISGEEYRVYVRQANSPRFLDAADEKVIIVIV